MLQIINPRSTHDPENRPTPGVFGVVYRIVCCCENRQYVGMTKQLLRRRINCHAYQARRGSAEPIHQAMRRHGRGAFYCEVLQECSSREELAEAEVEWIDRMRHQFGEDRIYNTHDGGNGFCPGQEGDDWHIDMDEEAI